MPSSGPGEALGLLLGSERRAQERHDLADRRVDKRDGGLDVDRLPGRDRRVDEDPGSVGAKPIVLAPRVRLRDLLDRADPGRRVKDAIDVANGVGDRGVVEEVESSRLGIAGSWPAASATGRNARPSTPVPPVTSNRIEDRS